jgi:hypothetical protein
VSFVGVAAFFLSIVRSNHKVIERPIVQPIYNASGFRAFPIWIIIIIILEILSVEESVAFSATARVPFESDINGKSELSGQQGEEQDKEETKKGL